MPRTDRGCSEAAVRIDHSFHRRDLAPVGGRFSTVREGVVGVGLPRIPRAIFRIPASNSAPERRCGVARWREQDDETAILGSSGDGL